MKCVLVAHALRLDRRLQPLDKLVRFRRLHLERDGREPFMRKADGHVEQVHDIDLNGFDAGEVEELAALSRWRKR
jgi:hypothetical protein